MRSNAEIISSVLFAFMALMHLARYLCPFDVTIGAFVVPEFISPLCFIAFGLLSAWLVRERVITTV